MLGAAAVAIWALVSATVSGPPPAATAARAPWTPTAASTTGAAARQLPSERVAAISVDAPSAGLERSAVEAIVQVVGAPYSIDAIRDSLQNLLALPDIADAQVIRSDHPRGLHLTFVVSPQPRLRQVHLTGDVPVSKSQLRRSLSIAPGDPLTEERIWAEAERLQQALADRGYSLASVEPRVLIAGDPTLGTLALAVSPGTLTRLGDFQIQVQIQDDIRGEIQGETGGSTRESSEPRSGSTSGPANPIARTSSTSESSGCNASSSRNTTSLHASPCSSRQSTCRRTSWTW